MSKIDQKDEVQGPKVTSCANRGFQITFENGYTISVQFGTMHYCERRDWMANGQPELSEQFIDSPNAEVAIWDANNHWQRPSPWFDDHNDDVIGYVSPDAIADMIHWTKEQ
jgi:hypothetical protein